MAKTTRHFKHTETRAEARITHEYFPLLKQHQLILYTNGSEFPVVRAYRDDGKARKQYKQWQDGLKADGYEITKTVR